MGKVDIDFLVYEGRYYKESEFWFDQSVVSIVTSMESNEK